MYTIQSYISIIRYRVTLTAFSLLQPTCCKGKVLKGHCNEIFLYWDFSIQKSSSVPLTHNHTAIYEMASKPARYSYSNMNIYKKLPLLQHCGVPSPPPHPALHERTSTPLDRWNRLWNHAAVAIGAFRLKSINKRTIIVYCTIYLCNVHELIKFSIFGKIKIDLPSGHTLSPSLNSKPESKPLQGTNQGTMRDL